VTDALCERALAEAPAEFDNPISTMVASTYGQGGCRDKHGLAATIVSFGCEMRAMMTHFQGPARSTAARLAESASATSYGRLFCASVLTDPRAPDAQAAFPKLLTLCWESGAYHLRLQALQRAEYFAGAPEPERSRILAVIESREAAHWALSSVLVEALAAFGEVHSELTVADLQVQIRRVIASPDDHEARQLASAFLSRRYDSEAIVGPYAEAIGTLTKAERALLVLMAVRSEGFSLFLADDLNDLASLVPSGDPDLDRAIKDEFATRAGVIDVDQFMPSEGIAAALAATIAWADLGGGQLLVPEHDAGTAAGTWQDLMTLVVHLHRDGQGHDLEQTWARLQAHPAAAVRSLASIHKGAGDSSWSGGRPIVPRLLRTWPASLEPIVSWAVANPSEARSPQDWLDVHQFAIWALGQVGKLDAVELLKPYMLDPDVGRSAVEAIRRINERFGECG
jgi:hypothetical protein